MTSVMDVPADIAPGRLSPREYEVNFDDATPPLNRKQALIEAARCYFCYDAPCIEACPTGIDIPSFIRKIATGQRQGRGGHDLGREHHGRHLRAGVPDRDPVRAGLRANGPGNKPVTIGALQRYATDWLFDREIQPFTRAEPTGKRVAVVGAGPAGLSCAHRAGACMGMT